MNVLHVAAEVFPLVKTGGLGDVTAALPHALLAHGVDARLLLPGLPAILDGIAPLRTIARFGPAFGAAAVTIRQGYLADSNVIAYVVDAPWLYDRAGGPYLDTAGREWADNAERFALLGWTAARLAFGEFSDSGDSRHSGHAASGWRADVLHAHDWHAALAPAYLGAHPAPRVKTLFTIHHLASQGRCPLDRAASLGLDGSAEHYGSVEFHGRGNFMKAGLVWADRITTVSPRYAEEIRTAEFGQGLEGVLRERGAAVSGILNGIDATVWNPATDPSIEHRYDADHRDGKARSKADLQRTLGLAVNARAPLFAIVSRLTDQKGIDLALAALPELVAAGAQLAVLGSGERTLEQAFESAAREYPGRLAVRIGYDEALAHRLIAGADAIIVPSRFEPCGLTQLYGLRYGTLPVVRRTGGLADTVTDATATPERGTGFSFDAVTPVALADAIRRAVRVFADGVAWNRLIDRAMAQDHSWSTASREYRDLYAALLASER